MTEIFDQNTNQYYFLPDSTNCSKTEPQTDFGAQTSNKINPDEFYKRNSSQNHASTSAQTAEMTGVERKVKLDEVNNITGADGSSSAVGANNDQRDQQNRQNQQNNRSSANIRPAAQSAASSDRPAKGRGGGINTPMGQSYYIALAQAIKSNPQLRQQFLDIVNPQQPVRQPEPSSQTAQPPNFSALRQEAEPVTTCTLDASIAEIESHQPNFFFAAPARTQLRNYLRENCPNLDRGEVYKILDLAIALENQAVEHYKNLLRHEKNIYNNNSAAISKLATDSAAAKPSGVEFNKIFTRADIRSMSLDDYRKNEKDIFAQYRAGLIK